jgi:hypothetical protein
MRDSFFANKELLLGKAQEYPKEIVPPSQSLALIAVMLYENPSSNEKSNSSAISDGDDAFLIISKSQISDLYRFAPQGNIYGVAV